MRDFTQYGGQTNGDGIFETPVRFILTTQTLQLTFEGWESSSAFDNEESPSADYRKIFEAYGADFLPVRSQFIGIFESLESSVLSFLEISGDDWEFESFSVNTLELSIMVAAKNKTKNRRISEQINTPEAFNETKQQHPELVTAFFVFAWTFGKMKDEFLASLDPVQ